MNSEIGVEMNSNPLCPKTSAPMHRGVRPMTLTYKDESITFEMPGWYCDECEESIHTGKDMKVSDRRLNRLKALSEGLLAPEKIRQVRKKLRLSQEAAGLLIGGGPRAFQKYESGDLLPSRAISSALVLLDHDPEALAVLKRRQEAIQTPAPRKPMPVMAWAAMRPGSTLRISASPLASYFKKRNSETTMIRAEPMQRRR